jgi:hypothetical protein
MCRCAADWIDLCWTEWASGPGSVDEHYRNICFVTYVFQYKLGSVFSMMNLMLYQISICISYDARSP